MVTGVYAHGSRSILASMLFRCQCKIYIMTEVAQLQGFSNEPRIVHLKRANALLKRAQSDTALVGLHYPFLTPPFCLRAVGGANHTTNTSVYSPQLVYLLTTGIAKFYGSKKITTCKQLLHRQSAFSESDLESIQRLD
eukprot:264178-Pyramimonas_sp.AAC.2